ncbi:transcriptional repressor [Nocardioides sp. zg-536]|uniref:Transcriptional repressor n=1 Tax=Nocardioides faecalis TaxID=2803858 RepID=A0A938Y3P7_9ACTN|nr:transcriptional repressor [Nocardioides faecalis]MBM9461642.1 transcriptional repressor [Nocardioides faecalis]MBS4753758.1 transcriptional repressor [Nocardioides faecalis]QVI57398.1 transcriptional repressor [Nocardioides faecalis]
MAGSAERLKAAGLRITASRLAVMVVLDAARRDRAHLLVAEIITRTEEILPRVPRQTVYDCLDALVAGDLASRVGLPGAAARYESTLGGDHHHLACPRCGRIRDAPCGATARCSELVHLRRFEVVRTQVVHVVPCGRCASTR